MSLYLNEDKPPNRPVDFVFPQDQDSSIPVEERYEVKKCVDWIKTNNYSKVCLQFPDSYLSDSVEVAFLIEDQINDKIYILGDTSYGSCCIDEIAAQHVQGDAIIHFGHTCLSQKSSLPVLHILPKRALDLTLLNNGHMTEIQGSSIVIYDVGYHHILGQIKKCFSRDDVIVPELIIENGIQSSECCSNCSLTKIGSHSYVRFSRAYCLQTSAPDNLIYIGSENDPCFINFILLFKDSKAWCYSNGTLVQRNTLKLYKQISYYTEQVRAATSLTVVLVSLSIYGYLEAVDYIKSIAKRWKKKIYVISISKPNIAKLTNFPEMEIFVIIGCPETHLVNNKEIIQPVVGLMEVELALNESRDWNERFSKDFKDLIPGGQDYIPHPEGPPLIASDVSIITGKLGGQNMTGGPSTMEVAINADKSLVSSSLKTGGKVERTWYGLQQAIGETLVSLAVPGRSGTSTGYMDEPNK